MAAAPQGGWHGGWQWGLLPCALTAVLGHARRPCAWCDAERALYVREQNDGLYRPITYLVFKVGGPVALCYDS